MIRLRTYLLIFVAVVFRSPVFHVQFVPVFIIPCGKHISKIIIIDTTDTRIHIERKIPVFVGKGIGHTCCPVGRRGSEYFIITLVNHIIIIEIGYADMSRHLTVFSSQFLIFRLPDTHFLQVIDHFHRLTDEPAVRQVVFLVTIKVYNLITVQ